MKIITFQLAGLTCSACVKLASNYLKKVPEVAEVNIDLASGETRISGADNLDLDVLAKSLVGTPYSIIK
ncbi:MAG: heavy metal-associated domain-containing protein [Patescibacteria group bacterium]